MEVFLAVLPVILLNGTTADANEVMADFNEIYTNITNINIAAGAGITFTKMDPLTVCGVSAVQSISNKTFLDNINFQSGTGFNGVLTHANTNNRTYIYPDSSGNVPSLPTAASTETGNGAIVRQNNPTINGITFTGVGTFADGTEAAPSITFTSDTNTGIFRQAADEIGITTGGTKAVVALNNAVNIEAGRVLRVQDGLVGSPAIQFSNDPDTGVYRSGANLISLVADGSQALEAGSTTVVVSANRVLRVQDGLVGTPGFCFNSDTNTGIFRPAADQLSIVANGSTRLRCETTRNVLGGFLYLDSLSNNFTDHGEHSSYSFAQTWFYCEPGIPDVDGFCVDSVSIEGAGATLRTRVNFTRQVNSTQYAYAGMVVETDAGSWVVKYYAEVDNDTADFQVIDDSNTPSSAKNFMVVGFS